MKKLLWILSVSLFTLQLSAQTIVRGVVRDSGTGAPLSGTRVSLAQQNISTLTNANGEFFFSHINAGRDEINLSLTGYFAQIRLINIREGEDNDLGVFDLRFDAHFEAQQEIMLQMSEVMLDDSENMQNVAGIFSSQTDVYISQTGFNFSPMRFRIRGYDNRYESTFINGVHFFDAVRGGFNFAMIGGLNNAMRSRDMVYGLAPNSFSFGNLGANTNIDTRASNIAAGSHASMALSNRIHKIRGQFTYGTGVLNSGWAFAVSGVIRWSDDTKDIFNPIEGTFNNSAGLFFSAEKFFNLNHSISFVAFGAPTRRAGQGPITQEARDLVGSIYYNPWWGFQDGRVRSSRIVESFAPTAIFSHDWNISDTQRLRTGVGFQQTWFSNSAFGYNGTHPAPDFHRNMPSFIIDDEYAREELARLWRTDRSTQQINWDDFYTLNRNNNELNPNGQARYVLTRRHSDLTAGMFNSTYTNQFTPNLRLTAGIGTNVSRARFYQTVDDLLGANQLLDIDQFVERELVGGNLQDANILIMRNNLRDSTIMRRKGDTHGYDYDLNIFTSNIFAQIEYSFDRISVHAGVRGTYTAFHRYGRMENGREHFLRTVRGQNLRSFGRSDTWWFTDPSVKGGFIYNINNRSHLSANILAETRAPLVRDAFINDRVKDRLVPGLTRERILSYDLNYHFNYRTVRGRISAFRTHIHDGIERHVFYDDEFRSLIYHSLSGLNQLHQGIEAGIHIPLTSIFRISAAATYADYRYTSNALGVKSWDNGARDDEVETVMTRGLRINTGPQLAANITFSAFYRMWFFDVTVNYFDRSFIGFSPNRFTQSNFGNLPAEFFGERNMEMLRSHFIDRNGEVHYEELMAWLADPRYKAHWGLEAHEAMNFGRFGGIVHYDENGKAVAIGPTETRQKLGTQERLNNGFMVDVSIGRIIYFQNRNSLNFNITINNVLNNTNMVSGGFQQGRIPMTGSDDNRVVREDGLNWFPNRYFFAMGFNFFAHVGFRF